MSGNFEILSTETSGRSESTSGFAFFADAYKGASDFVEKHPIAAAGMVIAAVAAPRLGTTLLRKLGSAAPLADEAASVAAIGRADATVFKSELPALSELPAVSQAASNPRFRINADASIRRFQPEDEMRVGEIANRLGLDKFYEGGRTTVLEAQGHGIVGYGQIIPGWTRNGSVTPGKVEILGVLPEFRNRSNMLIKGMVDDMRDVGGTWRTSAFDDTSGRLMRYYEKKNLVQVHDRWSSTSGSGHHPITHYTFSVR